MAYFLLQPASCFGVRLVLLFHINRPAVGRFALGDRLMVVEESPSIDTAQPILWAQVFNDLVRVRFLLPVVGAERFHGLYQESVILRSFSFANCGHDELSKKNTTSSVWLLVPEPDGLSNVRRSIAGLVTR